MAVETNASISKVDSTSQQSGPKKYLLGGLSILISIILVAYLLRFVNFNGFIEIAKKIPLLAIPCGLFLYLSINLWRAMRFRVLLGESDISLRHLFPIVLYHNFLLQTLPFLTGEVSYIILIKKYFSKRYSDGVSSLFSSRLFDLLIVIIIGIVGVLCIDMNVLENPHKLILILITCLILLSPVIYYSDIILRIVIKYFKPIINWRPWHKIETANRIKSSIENMLVQQKQIRNPSIFFKTLILSFLTHMSNFGFLLLLLWAAGVSSGIGTLLLIIIMVMIASWFKLSFSGFGVMEGGWTMGLIVLGGLDPVQAATIGFFIHGCQVIANVSTGMLGLGLLLKMPRTNNEI